MSKTSSKTLSTKNFSRLSSPSLPLSVSSSMIASSRDVMHRWWWRRRRETRRRRTTRIICRWPEMGLTRLSRRRRRLMQSQAAKTKSRVPIFLPLLPVTLSLWPGVHGTRLSWEDLTV
nr:hypothetical protein Iba_scaffold19679CG0030 [Ipomoea batatas]